MRRLCWFLCKLFSGTTEATLRSGNDPFWLARECEEEEWCILCSDMVFSTEGLFLRWHLEQRVEGEWEEWEWLEVTEEVLDPQESFSLIGLRGGSGGGSATLDWLEGGVGDGSGGVASVVLIGGTVAREGPGGVVADGAAAGSVKDCSLKGEGSVCGCPFLLCSADRVSGASTPFKSGGSSRILPGRIWRTMA